MPSYPPRTSPIKKKEQLEKAEMELVLAIRKKESVDKQIKFVEKYRQAQLSLLKAKIHEVKENEFQKKQNTIKIEKLELQIAGWTSKPSDKIIDEIKSSQKS